MKLKLDLHTHCFEAESIISPQLVTVSVVEKIISCVLAKGLDGIAITEHHNKDFGTVAKMIISRQCNDQIMIIPGWEIFLQSVHVVELFLPADRVFRFLPHPIYLDYLERSFDFSQVQAIEIKNYHYDQFLDKPRIKAIAEKYVLLLLSNSDAHELTDIGYHYNEISLEELSGLAVSCSRASLF